MNSRAIPADFRRHNRLVMGLAGLLGWFMAKRALTHVEEVTQTARAISGSDLEQRVPVKGHAEEIDRSRRRSTTCSTASKSS